MVTRPSLVVTPRRDQWLSAIGTPSDTRMSDWNFELVPPPLKEYR
jgi:hypothetical protein